MDYTYALIFNNKQDLDKVVDIISSFDNSNSKPPVCSKCGKDVDKKVVNFCKVRFKGRTICRECQKEV